MLQKEAPTVFPGQVFQSLEGHSGQFCSVFENVVRIGSWK